MNIKYKISSFLNHSLGSIVLLIVAIITFIVLPMNAPMFYNLHNITNLLRQNAPLLILASGLLLVMRTGGVDLSIASVFGFSGMLFGFLRFSSSAFAIVLAAALLFGFLQGILTYFLKIPSILLTLLTGYGLRAGIFLLFGNDNIFILGDSNSWLADIVNVYFMGIPVMAIFALLLWLLTLLLVSASPLSDPINKENPRSRSPLFWHLTAYSLCSAFASIAGILLTLRIQAAQPLLGAGYILDVLLIAIPCGCSLAFEHNKTEPVFITLLTTTIFGALRNLMILLNISSASLQVSTIALLVVFLLLDRVYLSNFIRSIVARFKSKENDNDYDLDRT